MTVELKELADKFSQNAIEIKNAQEKMLAEVKETGKAAAETKAALEKAQAEQSELKSRFEALDKQVIEMQLEAKRHKESQTVERKSLGELFVKNELLSSIQNSRRGVVEIEKKDITSLSTSAGALIRNDRDPEVYRNPNRPIRIRDLIPSMPTTSGAVEVMRQNVFTNNAAPQGTVAGIGGGEFVAKGQSNITWNLEVYPIRTIAHWVPASRQALSDASMLQNLIDVDLSYGLELEADEQLLLGDGTGQNVTGLLVDADVQTVGQIAAGTTAAQLPGAMIDHIRAAVTKCQQAEYYNMTGIILNPADWETLETAKATDGHYLMLQFPANGADSRIWKMPVVVTNAMPEGSFILGDFTMGAKLYERESISIRVSESHNDYFVKNGVAVLAEERYTMAVTRPKAFCKGLFTVAS